MRLTFVYASLLILLALTALGCGDDGVTRKVTVGGGSAGDDDSVIRLSDRDIPICAKGRAIVQGSLSSKAAGTANTIKIEATTTPDLDAKAPESAAGFLALSLGDNAGTLTFELKAALEVGKQTAARAVLRYKDVNTTMLRNCASPGFPSVLLRTEKDSTSLSFQLSRLFVNDGTNCVGEELEGTLVGCASL